MKNRTIDILAAAAVLATSIGLVHATCTGKTKPCETTCDTCNADGTGNGMACTYSCGSPIYDVCDTANTMETGKICNTGPERLSGIKNVPYAGTCAGAACNNGIATGEGALMTSQPYKVSLASCGG